jgi:DNA polymerase III delta subunit
VQQQFDADGVLGGRDVADRLVELAGEDTLLLRNEIAKLVAWAAGGAIGTRDVEALVVPEIETGAWELVDSWGARDVAAALTACEAMLHDRDEPFSISARLASHIASVRAVHGLLEQDLGVREITQRLGMRNEFPARKQATGPPGSPAASCRTPWSWPTSTTESRSSRVSAVLELQHAIVDVTTGREIRPA